ncbi:MAG: hypothetical protein WC108_02085 [Bacteroidales bacterium]|jgi:hypothetical protein|nr:hypothetical protein [Bacteroidales bacterium]
MRKKFWKLKNKWKSFYPQLKHKHRLIVLDSDTFTEKFTFKLTGINLFTAIGLSVIILIILTTVLIAFTPLREYIPGYSNEKMEAQTYKNAEKIDSLTNIIRQQELMLNNIRMIVYGEDIPQITSQTNDTLKNYDIIQLKRSKEDSLLRLSFEKL